MLIWAYLVFIWVYFLPKQPPMMGYSTLLLLKVMFNVSFTTFILDGLPLAFKFNPHFVVVHYLEWIRGVKIIRYPVGDPPNDNNNYRLRAFLLRGWIKQRPQQHIYSMLLLHVVLEKVGGENSYRLLRFMLRTDTQWSVLWTSFVFWRRNRISAEFLILQQQHGPSTPTWSFSTSMIFPRQRDPFPSAWSSAINIWHNYSQGIA